MARPLPPKPYRIGLAWRIALPSSGSFAKGRAIDHGLLLSIKELFDYELIEENAFRTGELTWHSGPLQYQGPLRFEADIRDYDTAVLRLKYEMDGIDLDYRVSLVFIEPLMGGRRWYFCCPLEHIRVTKLFLPPGARRFASRQAHGLPDSPIRAKRMRRPAA
jgi:hypothetical protein